MNTRFADVIRYNPTRLYFGTWTPKMIYAIYQENRGKEENRTTNIDVGVLSVDEICDALWNEMSYNPERFGTKSPFMFNGVNSIQKFCDYYNFYNPNDKKIIVFKNISDKLKGFLELMKTYDPAFAQNHRISNPTMAIGLEEDSEISNIEYKILSKLISCIHLVCSQNGEDYARSKKHHIRMNEVILARHPNVVRPNKIPNYRIISSIQAQQPAISTAILEKENEIAQTQMRISVLEEYEAPGDTSHETNLLEKQRQELEKLEAEYQKNAEMLQQLYGKQK